MKNTVQGVALRLLNKLKLVYSRFHDPQVPYTIGATTIRLPLSHPLPLLRSLFPEYSLNVARVAVGVSKKYPDLVILDVGANVGDTVAILRSMTDAPIVAVEGDDTFFGILTENAALFPDVELVHTYLSDAEKVADMHLQTRGGTQRLFEDAVAGEAESFNDITSSQRREVRFRSVEEVLRGNPKAARIKLVKVDTDGFDGKIIAGARSFIAANKPVLFFEYDPGFYADQNDDGLSFLRTLRDLGYAGGFVYDERGVLERQISLERLEDFVDLHLYLRVSSEVRYVDLCLFHREDTDVQAALLASERAHFEGMARRARVN